MTADRTITTFQFSSELVCVIPHLRYRHYPWALASRVANKIAAGVSVGCAKIPHSSQADRRTGKIIFLAMTLARFTRRRVRRSASSRAQPVSPALRSPFLFAPFRLAIAMPRLPLSPSAGLFAALLTAVACPGVNRAEWPLASFQQASPTPRTPYSPPRTCLGSTASLIFFRA